MQVDPNIICTMTGLEINSELTDMICLALAFYRRLLLIESCSGGSVLEVVVLTIFLFNYF
jgi:hypothetical protein